MTTKQRARLERMLRDERTRIARTLDRIGAASRGDDVDGGSPPPGEDAPTVAIGVSEADDTAIGVRERAALDDVDAALRLIAAEPDRYGVCAVCGRPIAMARLELVPATRYCDLHAPTG